jgi:hypothetical protein
MNRRRHCVIVAVSLGAGNDGRRAGDSDENANTSVMSGSAVLMAEKDVGPNVC